MTREEIISEIKCLLAELDNGADAVSYLTQNDTKWLVENIKALEQEPKTGWIPVSEKLPKLTNYYLIQYSRKICADEMAVAYYSVEEAELDKNYTWEFKPQCGEYKEVVAWQPLPKPYSEVEQ